MNIFGPSNRKAFINSLIADVVRCVECEGVIGNPKGPADEYVVVIQNGKTYHERCAPKEIA